MKENLEQLRLQATMLAQQGQWDEAIDINNRIIDNGNPTASDYNRLGRAYQMNGDLTKAQDAYGITLKYDPHNTIASKQLYLLHELLLSESEDGSLNTQVSSNNSSPDTHLYSLNARVQMKSSHTMGIIIELLPRNQYRVFINENEQPIVSEVDIEPFKAEFGWVNAETFLRDLLLFKLRRPLSDTFYTFSATRTNFEAYQFKPAIRFLRSPNSRLLIADEVGLGKTIEACIIYLELRARMQGDLPRVLVVCPAGLRLKWKSELKARFNEEFEIMDTNRIREYFSEYKQYGSSARLRGICSIETMRPEHISEQIVENNIQFDLVIVDEAHHMRNPDALTHDLGETLSGHSDAMIMLTATPVQLKSTDLFYLLNILDPGEFENTELFEFQMEPNKLINLAVQCLAEKPPNVEKALSVMEKCNSHFGTNALYIEAKQLLSKIDQIDSSQAGRECLVRTIRTIQQLNPFSFIFSRTRRKEAQQGASRQATVLDVELTPTEIQIHSKSLQFAKARARFHKGYASVLGLIQVERQIASSIGAFKDVIHEFERDNNVQIGIESSSTELDNDEPLSRDIGELCKQLKVHYDSLGDTDSKFDLFYSELQRLLAANSNTKVIVYSFFRRTIAYLERKLRAHGFNIEVIHGGKAVSDRQVIMERFRTDDNRRILLSSEVGAEGLDLQFCDTIINYDLPWNPMRVEQRIGRIDRYGQKSAKVKIISLFLRGTIEERILKRLYTRIRVFEESIGGLEPILGNIEKELHDEIISQSLTEDQEKKKVDQFLTMLEHRKLEHEEFEKNRYEILGDEQLFQKEVTDNIDSGRYVSPAEVLSLLRCYFAIHAPDAYIEKVDDSVDDIWKLWPSQKLIDNLRALLTQRNNKARLEDWQFIQHLQNALSSKSRVFETSPQWLRITFDGNTALKGPLLDLINSWHSLVRLAFSAFNKDGLSDCQTRMIRFSAVDTIGGKKGTHHFFTFYMSTRAIADWDELVNIVLDENGNIDNDLSERFLKLMQVYLPEDLSSSDVHSFDTTTFYSLKEKAFELMAEFKKVKETIAIQRNDALITSRQAALEKTYEAKKRRIQQRLDKATDERIIRMHQGELRNMETKHQNALAEVEKKRQVSLYYEPVAFGVVELKSAK